MKLNKRAALLTLLTVSLMLVIIVAVVALCLYIPPMYIIGGALTVMFGGIILSIYRSFCGDDGFRK